MPYELENSPQKKGKKYSKSVKNEAIPYMRHLTLFAMRELT